LKPQPAKANARRAADSRAALDIRSTEWNCDWIPSVAEPYLRGYATQFERGKSLLGYRFLAQPSAVLPPSGRKTRLAGPETPLSGFFIGYLLNARGLPFLKPAPPEFLVFCFVEPIGGRLHRRLVSEPDSLMRRTAEYIRWLTHHPPRFELYADEDAALVRHIPSQEWPADRIEHYARNFTIETLAWLVRSALVRRLPDEMAPFARPASASRAAGRK
jgi:hypothetical protein